MIHGGIEQMMWTAVAGQKSSQANHAAGIRRADQHRTAGAGLEQIDPAQDQRPHDALAEIGFRHQQRTQPLRCNQQRFDLAFGVTIDQRDAARQLTDFGQELPGSLIDHRCDMAEPVALGDRDMAGQQDKHSRTRLAGLE